MRKKTGRPGLSMKKKAAVFIFCLFVLPGPNAAAGPEQTEPDYYQYDEIAGFVHRPGAKRVFDWPEHPAGKITTRTNNLGFREDRDTAPKKAEGSVRILVTGDSHTDGVVNNKESFPNVLEELLNAGNPKTLYEVINGGVGQYELHHYELFFRKYSYLNPDMLIIAVYTGNDFGYTAAFVEKDGNPVRRSLDYFERLSRFPEAKLNSLPQALNQVYYFRHFPFMKKKVLEKAAGIFAALHEACLQQNTDLSVVLLPSKADVEWETDAAALDAVKEGLGLERKDLAVNRELKDALKEILEARGITVIDPWAAMKAENRELFWKQDHHLNVDGHRLIAGKIYERLISRERIKAPGTGKSSA